MSPIKNVEYYTIFKHKEHCVNQIAMRVLKNGDLIAVFNEERFPYHHDSGQTLLTRSKDGGKSWSEPTVVLAWTATQGNWDCGICELEDGTLLVNEVNTLPGLTDVSGFPKMWEASGVPFSQIIDQLIELAIERHRERARNETSI